MRIVTTLALPSPQDFVTRIARIAGARVARMVRIWVHQRRILRELTTLPECDLRRMRMSHADLGIIAREEARQRSDIR